MNRVRDRKRSRLVPLWIKLAIYGAVGVVVVHAVHIVLGNYLTTRSLLRLQALQGQALADTLARPVAEALLVGDRLRAQELANDTLENPVVQWCLVERGTEMLAAARRPGAYGPLVDARPPGEPGPLLMTAGEKRYLEVAAPLLGGRLGRLRLGYTLDEVYLARRHTAMVLGTVASVVLLLGFLAALVVGRFITRPVRAMLEMTGSFDPAEPPPRLAAASRDEIGLLARQFESMMNRLHQVYRERQQFLQRQAETERLAALGTLAAGLAHEINNPLAGMKNCQRRLAAGELEPERQSRYLQLLAQGIERVESLVGQLLDFARPARLQVETVDPGWLLQGAADLVQPLAEKARAQLVIDCDGDLPPLAGDHRRLEQALVNLLLNAIQVTEAGETIVLEARPAEKGVVLSVSDNGPGIPPPLRSRVTEPFFTTKAPGQGTGLGLSVTATIVQAHGGRLDFEFPERGTRARIWLPAAGSAEKPAGQESS